MDKIKKIIKWILKISHLCSKMNKMHMGLECHKGEKIMI